jgi:hypothetical protein
MSTVAVAPPSGTTALTPTPTELAAIEGEPHGAWTPEPTDEVQSVPPPVLPTRRLPPSWRVRDRRLVIASATMGFAFGASAIAGIALGVELRKSVDGCTRATYTHCEAAKDRVQRLLPPSYAVAAIAGVSLVGLIVSGVMLGVHRSRRPEIAQHGGGPRFAMSSQGVRVRF